MLKYWFSSAAERAALAMERDFYRARCESLSGEISDLRTELNRERLSNRGREDDLSAIIRRLAIERAASGVNVEIRARETDVPVDVEASDGHYIVSDDDIDKLVTQFAQQAEESGRPYSLEERARAKALIKANPEDYF